MFCIVEMLSHTEEKIQRIIYRLSIVARIDTSNKSTVAWMKWWGSTVQIFSEL